MPLPSFSYQPMPPRKPPMTWDRRKKLIVGYAPDWIITIGLAAAFFALDTVNGYRRDFSLTDPSLLHPYAVHERITTTSLVLICFVAPFVLLLAINLFTLRSFWDAHCAILGLILALATAGSATQFTKITAGRPRPDLISRCQPPMNATDPPFGLSTSDICTNTNEAIMKDGWRSFFSGHSSLSFAGLGFLAFYLAGKLHLFDRRGHAIKAWICLTPFAGASLVAISRTMDYRHHWQDVVVGSLLGTALAYFSYRQYYPSLASRMSHRPYSPRIERLSHIAHSNSNTQDTAGYSDETEEEEGDAGNALTLPTHRGDVGRHSRSASGQPSSLNGAGIPGSHEDVELGRVGGPRSGAL